METLAKYVRTAAYINRHYGGSNRSNAVNITRYTHTNTVRIAVVVLEWRRAPENSTPTASRVSEA